MLHFYVPSTGPFRLILPDVFPADCSGRLYLAGNCIRLILPPEFGCNQVDAMIAEKDIQEARSV
jgi:hypothetical protein